METENSHIPTTSPPDFTAGKSGGHSSPWDRGYLNSFVVNAGMMSTDWSLVAEIF
jgi:hypothetical protein